MSNDIDTIALHCAAEVMAIVKKKDWPGGDCQMQAGIQCAVIEALKRHHPVPASCKHTWIDDGQFLLVCTACGDRESHDPAVVVDERKTFEKAVIDKAERFHPDLEQYGDHPEAEYRCANIEWAWGLWQARAALCLPELTVESLTRAISSLAAIDYMSPESIAKAVMAYLGAVSVPGAEGKP